MCAFQFIPEDVLTLFETGKSRASMPYSVGPPQASGQTDHRLNATHAAKLTEKCKMLA